MYFGVTELAVTMPCSIFPLKKGNRSRDTNNPNKKIFHEKGTSKLFWKEN